MAGIPIQGTLTSNGSFPISNGSILVPVQAGLRIVIYVRPGGNDTTGDGKTIGTAFRTVQHALDTIPIITRGERFVIDITGINDSNQAIIVPPYFNSDPLVNVNSPPLSNAFVNEGFVSIQAQPTVLVTLNSGTTTVSTDSITSLNIITDTSQSWTVDGYKGKFVVGANFQFGVIYHNTATQLFVSSTVMTTSSPIQIVDCGATLGGSAGTATIQVSGVRAKIVISGVNIQNAASTTPPIQGSNLDYLQLNLVSTRGLSITSGFAVETLGTYILGNNGGAGVDTTVSVDKFVNIFSYIYNATPSLAGTICQLSGCILENVRFLDTNGGAGMAMDISFTQFVTQGLVLMGSSCSAQLFDVRVDNCVPVPHINPNGSGIIVQGGATVNINEGSLGGSGNDGYGLEINSGGTVCMEVTEPVTFTITGTLGDLKVGKRPTRSWTNFTTSHPVNTEVDVYTLSSITLNNDAQTDYTPITPIFNTSSRPAANSVAMGSIIVNTDGYSLDISDGYSNWFSAGGGGTIVTTSIASLRASSFHLSADFIEVLGYYADGDMGGGSFYWDSSSSAADDSGVIIKPASVSGTGRWIRKLKDSTINVNWYGAKADGIDDLGARVTSVDGYLSTNPGTIYVPDGYWLISTQIHLHQYHKLEFGVVDVVTTTSVPTIVYDSNTEICGVGWDTIIREPTSSVHTLICGYASTTNNYADGESNVSIHDFQIQGPYAATFDSAAGVLGVGNAHNVFIERIWINKTKAIGLNIGAGSNDGYFSENIWIKNCLFTGIASQMVGIVNTKTFHVVGNTFRDGGQTGSGTVCTMLDIEENLNTCWAGPFEITGNVFDGTNNQTAGNAIDITGSGLPASWPEQTGPGVISGNTIQGVSVDTDPFPISNGIALTNAHGILVIGNKIKRTGQSGITINSTYQSSIINNSMLNCGGGGIPGLTMTDSIHNFISGNAYHVDVSSGAGPSYSAFVESGSCDYNIFTNNFIDVNASPASGNFIVMVGANSIAYNNNLAGRTVHHSVEHIPTTTITTSRALTISDGIVFVNTTSGVITLTLADATEGAASTSTGTTGRNFKVKRIAGSNSIVLSPINSQTIDGTSSLTIYDDSDLVLQSDGANWHSMGRKTSNVKEFLLTTTTATDVLNIASPTVGNYMLAVYYRIITASTNISISATWTDASGAQSALLVNITSQTVGSYSVAPFLINVVSGSIKITATAGTANQIYVSANAGLL